MPVMQETVRVITVRDMWDSLDSFQRISVRRLVSAIEENEPLPQECLRRLSSLTPDQRKAMEMILDRTADNSPEFQRSREWISSTN